MRSLWNGTGNNKRKRKVIMKTESEISAMSMDDAVDYLLALIRNKSESIEDRKIASRMLFGYIKFVRMCE